MSEFSSSLNTVWNMIFSITGKMIYVIGMTTFHITHNSSSYWEAIEKVDYWWSAQLKTVKLRNEMPLSLNRVHRRERKNHTRLGILILYHGWRCRILNSKWRLEAAFHFLFKFIFHISPLFHCMKHLLLKFDFISIFIRIFVFILKKLFLVQ